MRVNKVLPYCNLPSFLHPRSPFPNPLYGKKITQNTHKNKKEYYAQIFLKWILLSERKGDAPSPLTSCQVTSVKVETLRVLSKSLDSSQIKEEEYTFKNITLTSVQWLEHRLKH